MGKLFAHKYPCMHTGADTSIGTSIGTHVDRGTRASGRQTPTARRIVIIVLYAESYMQYQYVYMQIYKYVFKYIYIRICIQIDIYCECNLVGAGGATQV